MKPETFKAERVTKTAQFVVNAEIDKAFPLFGAFEERKWEPIWNPELIYPETEIIEEGTTFKTEGRGEEPEFLWRVTKFEEGKHLIQYLVSTENRYWTITVQCLSEMDNLAQTLVNVTYTYIGLNEAGNRLNKADLECMYSDNLSDWAESINSYLELEGA